ncbi:3-dehydroquinate synthase [Arenibaculum pallidiluteum]|uniref:3-dehydroquinate synthase n=1 Tax=Arenibaculum pallidiluteum TaxID=2812559 RepID=UPI001A974DAA|nr:3-dehydroquinate synthase [Arenibaculum pallidiluteum]
MTETVRVPLGARSYDILIGSGLIAGAGPLVGQAVKSRRIEIVTDENVAPRHLDPLTESLHAAGFRPGEPIVLPPGEKTKDFARLEGLLDVLLGRGIERSTVLVALGGGVIGDLVGFAAATALRGLDFIQVPTTLLAQVDSSVGGKTGINSRHGKNLIGAFHQPRLVLADTGALATLPARELRAGYAEVVKYGVIDDAGFFSWLERQGAAVLGGDEAARREAVRASCAAKARIVGADERESAERALLNLGHTFGHALEAECGYGGDLLHGEAVAIGMCLAMRLSVKLGLCPPEELERLLRHLDATGLPTALPRIPGVQWNADRLMGHMAHDKKVQDGRLTFILARGIGKSFVARDVDPAEARAVLAEAVAAQG